jgi:hypothetical protein
MKNIGKKLNLMQIDFDEAFSYCQRINEPKNMN